MLYGSEPEAHLQFYLHVDHSIFKRFINGCIEVDYGNDDLFVSENDCFAVKLFSTTQRRRTDFLSLAEQSFLNVLLFLYKETLSYEDFHAYVWTVCYKASVFKRLSDTFLKICFVWFPTILYLFHSTRCTAFYLLALFCLTYNSHVPI